MNQHLLNVALQDDWDRRGLPRMQIRIGINTGRMVVGNIGSPDRLNYTGGNEYFLGWRDLLGPGASTALQPMILGPSSVTQGASTTYTVKMRPCYPYPERVNFTIQPGTWNGNTFIPEPKSTTASQNSSVVSRSFNTTGPKTLVVTNMTDGNGRNIRVPYSRTIQVVPAGCGDTTPPAVATKWTSTWSARTCASAAARPSG